MRQMIGRAASDRKTASIPVAGRRRMLGMAASSAAVLGATALARGARPSGAAAQLGAAGIAGAWLVTVPVTPLGRFITVQTFSIDGTSVTQFQAGGEQQGASLGAGVWGQTGDRRFAMTFSAGLYEAKTGATTGIATIQGSVLLDEPGDAWAGEYRVTFLDPAGRQLDQTPLLPVSGTRIRLEPPA